MYSEPLSFILAIEIQALAYESKPGPGVYRPDINPGLPSFQGLPGALGVLLPGGADVLPVIVAPRWDTTARPREVRWSPLTVRTFCPPGGSCLV